MNRRRPVPHPNTYWVRPGRLLAGEYPGEEDARGACEKLRLFLDALSGRRVVYVHCWGGTGRTGTVVGCHLVRRRMRGDTALRRVMELWSTMAKARFRCRSPETDEQRRYVLEWKEQPAPEPPEVPAGS